MITSSIADKFRSMADTCAREADKKRNSGTHQQRPTRRRLAQIASSESDARRLDALRGALLGLADAHDDGTIPAILTQVKTKDLISSLLRQNMPYDSDHAALAAAGIQPDRWLQAAQALEYIAVDTTHESPVERQIKDAERGLFGLDIPGYFPTPNKTATDPAHRLIQLAHIEPDMLVLEPSAGKGNLVDLLWKTYQIRAHCIEINSRLRDILKLKEHTLIADDFMEFDQRHPGWCGHRDGYDRIILNPPFENLQDIDHIRRAYTLLRPGGRLAAICSESPFFRSERKAQEFRVWLSV